MKKEKWLTKLIFDTPLFKITVLSKEEDNILKRYLKDQKTPDEIAMEIGLTENEVEKLIKTTLEKIISTLKEFLAKKIWANMVWDQKIILQNEVRILKERFKKELAEDELKAEEERFKIPISNLSLSVRAYNVLGSLNIKTLDDLETVKLHTLRLVRNAGFKTVNEIVAKALDLGIKIS